MATPKQMEQMMQYVTCTLSIMPDSQTRGCRLVFSLVDKLVEKMEEASETEFLPEHLRGALAIYYILPNKRLLSSSACFFIPPLDVCNDGDAGPRISS